MKVYRCYVNAKARRRLRGETSWPLHWRAHNSPKQADALLVNPTQPPDWLAEYRRTRPTIPVIFVTDSSDEPVEFEFSEFDPAQLNGLLKRIEPIADALAQVPPAVRETIAGDPYLAMAAYLWSRNRRADLRLDRRSPSGYRYDCEETLPRAREILINMAHAGYLGREVGEAAHCCPRCDSLQVLLRDTCVECASVNIREETLLHHFSCSHQGQESAFLKPSGEYVCPKCQKTLRHFGMDYDKPGSIVRCRGCGHQSAETQIRGRCLACDNRFAIEQSPRQALYDYVLNEVGVHALFQGRFTTAALTDILEPKPGLLSPEVLAMMVKKFAAVEKRYGIDSVLLKIELANDAGVNESLEQRVKLITAVGQELARLRTTDSVAYHLGQLLILLPGCNEQGLNRIIGDFKTIVGDMFGQETVAMLRFSKHSIRDPLPLAA